MKKTVAKLSAVLLSVFLCSVLCMTAIAVESNGDYDDVQTIYHLMTAGEPITLIDESGNEVAPPQWDKNAVFQSISSDGLTDAEIVYYMLKYGEPIACEDSTEREKTETFVRALMQGACQLGVLKIAATAGLGS